MTFQDLFGPLEIACCLIGLTFFFVYTKRLLDVITLQVPPILLLIRGAEGELLYGEKIVRTEVNVVFVKL